MGSGPGKKNEQEMGNRGAPQDKKVDDDESPWDSAGLLTKYSLGFVWPLLRLAWRDELSLEHLKRPPRADESRYLGERLEANYRRSWARGGGKFRTKEKSFSPPGAGGPSLIGALFRTFGKELLLANLFNTLTRNLLLPLQTISLGWLLEDIRLYSNLKTIMEVFTTGGSESAGQENSRNGENTHHYAHNHHSHHHHHNQHYEFRHNNESALPERRHELEGELEAVYWKILMDMLLIIATTCLASCSLHPFFFQTYHIGMKCRVAVCHLIYKKSLKLSQSALRSESTSSGQMINLLSNDVNRFDLVVQTVPFLFDGPLCVLLVSWILARYYLGFLATLSGLLVVVLFMLLQGSIGKLFGRFRLRASKRTDERVQLTGEIMAAIKVLKMYAWEEAFERLVMLARRRELHEISQTFLVRAVNITSFFMSSKLIVFTMLIVYIQLECGPLNPELIFVAIGLCNLVRITITMYLANAFAQCAEALISCQRINKFLGLPEIGSSGMGEADFQLLPELRAPNTNHSAEHPPKEQTPAVRFERVYAWWGSKELAIVLRNLSFAVNHQELVLVVGRVGSGKSSVLMALLGELPVASGRLELGLGCTRISYASQEPWLFAGSIRDNILFGKALQVDKYRQVVRACCLERDLAQMPEGDRTQVGERGVALSGGQRARVNLARALYHEADLYLLDDPLSAVDGHVARHIVDECFAQANGFLAKKTVLLATHQLQYLRRADKVLLVDQQAPALFGTPTQVVQSKGFELIQYAREALEEAARESNEHDGAEAEPEVGPKDQAAERDTEEQVDGQQQQQQEEGEDTKEVASDAATYLYYLRNSFTWSAGLWFLAIVVLAQASNLWIDFMLARWTDSREQLETLGPDLFEPRTFIDRWTLDEMLSFYGLSIVFGLVATLLVCITFGTATVRASRRMHARAFHRLLAAKMAFFATTPIGSILNRMSRDLGFIDQTLPLSALEILMILSNVTAIIILTISINFYNSFVVLFLLLAAGGLRSASLRAIAKLKQLDGVTRSPVFSHLSATLGGLATIRAFRQQAHFRLAFDRHQDRHSGAWFAYMCTTRWLGQAMDWTSVSFVSFVVAAVVLLQLDSTSASLIGLLISQAVYMPGMFQAGMRQLVDAESQMTSVQRVKRLCELEGEREALHSPQPELAQRPTGSLRMPSSGCIKFTNVSLRYASEQEPVLRNLNLTIRPREKIGIVGRTGAGKSSLIAILFRLYPFEGRLEIDGRDTKQMGLTELRRTMSIIPQEPVLFGGSLRRNLDPLGEHSDGQLWEALEAVQMKSLFCSDSSKSSFAPSSEAHAGQKQPRPLGTGLEFQVSEGGANLSVGQRQLICLARAILRRNKILVLDEATASVDPETDEFIQRTITQHFASCTVLTIAHRLITIASSDRVLVLDRGVVREFGDPKELLDQRPPGAFRQMVDSTEREQAARLIRLIEESHESRLAAATSQRPSTSKMEPPAPRDRGTETE